MATRDDDLTQASRHLDPWIGSLPEQKKDPMAAPSPSPNVGFLAILNEASGTLGGLLVTNAWGRPLEFRLTSAVQPNRVQAILYGAALPGFLAGELIGKTLVDKTTTPLKWIVTDAVHALDLRNHVPCPVALSTTTDVTGTVAASKNLVVAERFAADVPLIAELLAQSPSLDLAEPFQRIRDAIVEARKLGPTSRAA
jgi:hypothetical protein